jgi:hypothetical protein
MTFNVLKIVQTFIERWKSSKQSKTRISQSECEDGFQKCTSYRILERELDIQRAEKEYFRELLLVKAGILKSGELEIDLQDFKPVHKHVSLSRLRAELEKKQRDMARKPSVEAADTEIAPKTELTEAEKLFELSLAKNKETIQ